VPWYLYAIVPFMYVLQWTTVYWVMGIDAAVVELLSSCPAVVICYICEFCLRLL
jgi:hypothetical protein